MRRQDKADSEEQIAKGRKSGILFIFTTIESKKTAIENSGKKR